MTIRRGFFAWSVVACTAGFLAGTGAPAMAGQHGQGGHGGQWRETHRAIYKLENLIALLEADPSTDDGYKAPIISRARADIMRLRATLAPPRWRWTITARCTMR